MIDGVTITPPKKIVDERGVIMHMLRNDSPAFKSFGEIYFSMVYPGVVKGWRVHKKMILNYAVPMGCIKFVLFDDREGSRTRGEVQEIFMGEDNCCLVTVPPMIWNGFKGVGVKPALIANCGSVAHDADEVLRMDPFDTRIPYKWDIAFK